MMAWFFLLALFLVECSSVKDTCTLNNFQGCLESLQSVTQNIALVTTHNELMDVCSSLKSSVLCVDEHMRNCFTATARNAFNYIAAGARQFVRELCIPGAIQSEYLKHSLCYRSVTLSEDKCAPKYRHIIKLSELVDNQADVNKGPKQFCCAFDAFVLCRQIYADRDCGKKALNFLQQHLDHMSNPLTHVNCEQFLHAQDPFTLSGSALSTKYQLPEAFTTTLMICIVVYLYISENKPVMQ